MCARVCVCVCMSLWKMRRNEVKRINSIILRNCSILLLVFKFSLFLKIEYFSSNIYWLLSKQTSNYISKYMAHEKMKTIENNKSRKKLEKLFRFIHNENHSENIWVDHWFSRKVYSRNEKRIEIIKNSNCYTPYV